MKITIDGKDFESDNLSENANKSVKKLQHILKKEQQLSSDYEDLQLVKDYHLKYLRGNLPSEELAELEKDEIKKSK
jgi:hypothetical protein|tara:strand:- start:580 stop:807 length:228 start_codon:yes stop_codon:yes gene_type:complete